MKTEIKAQDGRKVSLIEKEENHLVDMDKISHIICVGNVTKIYLIENDMFYTTTKLLKTWEEELTEFSFVRINRNTLTNLRHVVTYKDTEKPTITLTTKKVFNVSHRKKNVLKNIFKNTKKHT